MRTNKCLTKSSTHVTVGNKHRPPDREFTAAGGDTHDQFTNFVCVLPSQNLPRAFGFLPCFVADVTNADPLS